MRPHVSLQAYALTPYRVSTSALQHFGLDGATEAVDDRRTVRDALWSCTGTRHCLCGPCTLRVAYGVRLQSLRPTRRSDPRGGTTPSLVMVASCITYRMRPTQRMDRCTLRDVAEVHFCSRGRPTSHVHPVGRFHVSTVEEYSAFTPVSTGDGCARSIGRRFRCVSQHRVDGFEFRVAGGLVFQLDPDGLLRVVRIRKGERDVLRDRGLAAVDGSQLPK